MRMYAISISNFVENGKKELDMLVHSGYNIIELVCLIDVLHIFLGGFL